MDQFVSELNQHFTEITNQKSRKSIISVIDAIYSRFLYCKPDTTKESVAAHINMHNGTSFDRTSLYRKEVNISVTEFRKLVTNIVKMHDDMCISTDKPTKVIAVDGPCSTTNIRAKKGKTQVSLNMGYFDSTNNVPVDLIHKGAEFRNTEAIQLIDYIKSKKLTDAIIVCDRAYFNHELIKVLIENNLKFVIRARNNSLIVKKKKLPKCSKHSDFINNETSIRIVTKKTEVTDVVKIKGNKKQKVKSTSVVSLITNLPIEYSDEHVLNIYKLRWDIEVFF